MKKKFTLLNAENAHDSANIKLRQFIHLRFVMPNIITIMAIVAGLSSIRMAFESRFDVAVILLLLAALLDGIDGRIARAIHGSSHFGEQLDSLADAINFGAVPALLTYLYILKRMGNLGWLAALIYSIACCLRLARFNVMLKNKNTLQKWKKNYFIGVPSPGGGCILLLPIYLGFLGMQINNTTSTIFCLYTIIIAILMISNLPVWNGKSIRLVMRRDAVIPMQLFVVIYCVLLVEYIWLTLAISTFAYLIFLPINSYFYYRSSRLKPK
ncbi:MAG: phosphatidylcholine synthase [Candidatus Tokpelaia sp. JSC161]|jgi:CDP-diacylglycerol--serine O-phosphatidyltransferase|nr:MAG: phosphatidylcholine synthase [Candidatus Tokpelaia sp. JSC161]